MRAAAARICGKPPRLRGAACMVGDRAGAIQPAAVGLLRRGRRAPRGRRARACGPHARRALVPAGAPEFRRKPAATARRRNRYRVLGRGPRKKQRDLRRAVPRSVAARAGTARVRHQAGRPRRRVHAQSSRHHHRDARCDQHRRDLVVVLAGFRRAGRARPLQPDRAAHPLFRRRLLLQRQDDRRAAASRGNRRGAAVGRKSDRRALHAALARDRPGAARSRRPRVHGALSRAHHRVRAATVQPSALHHVFVRHHGRAQVHRPRRGRHAAAAFQRAGDARRPQTRRPPVLFHDVRLDDVELARHRARVRRDAAALRRLAVRRQRQHSVRFRGRQRHDGVRHLGQIHRCNRQGRLAARANAQARHRSPRDLDRFAARGRRLRLRLRAHQARRDARLDVRRHRHHGDFRVRLPAVARVARRNPVRDARHAGRGVRR